MLGFMISGPEVQDHGNAVENGPEAAPAGKSSGKCNTDPKLQPPSHLRAWSGFGSAGCENVTNSSHFQCVLHFSLIRFALCVQRDLFSFCFRSLRGMPV